MDPRSGGSDHRSDALVPALSKIVWGIYYEIHPTQNLSFGGKPYILMDLNFHPGTLSLLPLIHPNVWEEMGYPGYTGKKVAEFVVEHMKVAQGENVFLYNFPAYIMAFLEGLENEAVFLSRKEASSSISRVGKATLLSFERRGFSSIKKIGLENVRKLTRETWETISYSYPVGSWTKIPFPFSEPRERAGVVQLFRAMLSSPFIEREFLPEGSFHILQHAYIVEWKDGPVQVDAPVEHVKADKTVVRVITDFTIGGKGVKVVDAPFPRSKGELHALLRRLELPKGRLYITISPLSTFPPRQTLMLRGKEAGWHARLLLHPTEGFIGFVFKVNFPEGEFYNTSKSVNVFMTIKNRNSSLYEVFSAELEGIGYTYLGKKPASTVSYRALHMGTEGSSEELVRDLIEKAKALEEVVGAVVGVTNNTVENINKLFQAPSDREMLEKMARFVRERKEMGRGPIQSTMDRFLSPLKINLSSYGQ